MKLSIRTRFILILLVIFVLTSIVYIITAIRSGNDVLNVEFNERINSLTKNLAMNCMYGILTSNVNELNKLAKNTIMQRDIISVSIEDKNGKVLVSAGGVFPNSKIREFAAPVYGMKQAEEIEENMLLAFGTDSNQESIGTVKVTASLAYFQRKINELIRSVVIIIFILFAFVIPLIIYMVSKYIGRPINNLVLATQNVAQGDLHYRVDIVSKDEFGMLADFFNNMTADLENSVEQIKKLAVEAAEVEMERTKATELKKINDRIVNISHELERSNKALEEFAYIASHDLQEPIRMVISYVQLLERHYKDKLDKDANIFINYAVDGAKRMQHLIQDLLMYARVGSKKKEFAVVDILNVLEYAKMNLTVVINESGAKILNGELPKVYGDKTQLIELFQNLLGNALKFRQKDIALEIHVNAEKKNNDWQFSIKDNGIGIQKEHFDRIFLIFQRLHSREEYPGTGIGLAYCKKIVEHHGGRIWVESEFGQGTTFFFTLPENNAAASGPAEKIVVY
jgi:signal transduction histidine kinase